MGNVSENKWGSVVAVLVTGILMLIFQYVALGLSTPSRAEVLSLVNATKAEANERIDKLETKLDAITAKMNELNIKIEHTNTLIEGKHQ